MASFYNPKHKQKTSKYVWQHFETQSSIWIKINFDPTFKWRGLDKINVYKVLTYNFSTAIGPHVYGSYNITKQNKIEKIMQCPSIKSFYFQYGSGFFFF
jgi:hypothetical protein